MVDLIALTTAFIGFSQWLVDTTGFLGLFIVNVLSAATIILPLPGVLVTAVFATVANPFLVAVIAGAGNAIGELTGYYIGLGGRHVIQKKSEKWLKKAQKWSDKHGTFSIIVLFGATPLPSDIVGLFAGVVKYDAKKFLLASFIGKTILNLMIAYASLYGFEVLIGYLGGL